MVVVNFIFYICLFFFIKKNLMICIVNSYIYIKMGFEGKFGGEFVDYFVFVMEYWV